MKIICGILVLALCIQTAISDLPIPDSPHDVDDDWISWAGLFEGDIALSEEQERQIMNITIVNGTERNGLIRTSARWPGAVMPYVFNSQFTDADKAKVRAAIADYTSNTCITLVERSNQADYIEFIKSGGCWSYVGRLGRGKQQVSLVDGCLASKGIIIHELMHAAGFFHEQSRSDRDSYVRINWQNIQQNRENNFNKYSSGSITAFGQDYDYSSVMHYSEWAFSKNGQKTIEALNGRSPLGQRNGFSPIDIAKINLMYNCNGATGATTAATTTTTGVTTTAAPGSCGDAMGSSNCSRWRRLCNRRRYRYFMMDACAETCGYCGANARCVDIHPVVCGGWANAGVCNWASYQTWMHTFCAASCDQC